VGKRKCVGLQQHTQLLRNGEFTALHEESELRGRLYPNNNDALTEQIQGYLNVVIRRRTEEDTPDDEVQVPDRPVRALIAPHSIDSGSVAAYAYQNLNPVTLSKISTIIVLHPHHCKIEFAKGRCLLSNAGILETPIGNLVVDDALRKEILGLSEQRFVTLKQAIDEQEHSGELQYPFIAHCLKLAHRLDEVAFLPIMVGDLKTTDEIAIGSMLRPILSRPSVLTIISTEFCHWGAQYKYQPCDPSMKIHEFITKLDRHAMECVRQQDPGALSSYILETGNTICGKHVLSLWLRAIWSSPADNVDNHDDYLAIDFVKYVQSKLCQSPADSSIGYAAAVATLKKAQG
jgi:MEMO1 family protein